MARREVILMPGLPTLMCSVCRNDFNPKYVRRVRHFYGKKIVYAFICETCTNNVARAKTKEEEDAK